jgi:SAM-dependent MidA family methyltransferase
VTFAANPPQTPLEDALIAAIAARGPITFADYMQIALYHPQGGYYTSATRPPQGWGGDYLTSTDLGPLFGAAIGRQLAQIWDLLGHPMPFVVLEDGAGRGDLARDVLAWAHDAASDAPQGFAAALAYHTHDVDGTRAVATAPETRANEERAVTTRANEERAVTMRANEFAPMGVPPRSPPAWTGDGRDASRPRSLPAPSAEGEQGSRGAGFPWSDGTTGRRDDRRAGGRVPVQRQDGAAHVILSNELIDALPVHVVERVPEGLAEVYVDVAGAPPRLVERLGPPSAPEVAGYLDRFRVPWARFPLGWRAEVNLAAEAWLAESAARLAQRGIIITIDYGDTARRLYTPERRRGTLIGYQRHELRDDLLAQTGTLDITTHVNFSALIAAGRNHGLRLAGLVTQREMLLALGIRTEAEAVAHARFPLAETERHTDAGQRDYLRRTSLMHAVSALIDPNGMGGFRVLVQQRGLPGIGKRLLCTSPTRGA